MLYSEHPFMMNGFYRKRLIYSQNQNSLCIMNTHLAGTAYNRHLLVQQTTVSSVFSRYWTRFEVFFEQEKYLIRTQKNYIYFRHLCFMLFTASSFLSVSLRSTALFSPKNLFSTGISSALPAPPFTHLLMTSTNVL